MAQTSRYPRVELALWQLQLGHLCNRQESLTCVCAYVQDTSKRVMVLAATNRRNAIDPALRRPGRLDREIEIGVPNSAQRGDILRVCLAGYPHHVAADEVAAVAAGAHGYVGADLAAVCAEAAMRALRRAALGVRVGGGSGGWWVGQWAMPMGCMLHVHVWAMWHGCMA